METWPIALAGDRLAPALRRLAGILQVNDRPLVFEHEGVLIRTLLGCRSEILVVIDPWDGVPRVVPDELWLKKPGNGSEAAPPIPDDTPLSPDGSADATSA